MAPQIQILSDFEESPYMLAQLPWKMSLRPPELDYSIANRNEFRYQTLLEYYHKAFHREELQSKENARLNVFKVTTSNKDNCIPECPSFNCLPKGMINSLDNWLLLFK